MQKSRQKYRKNNNNKACRKNETDGSLTVLVVAKKIQSAVIVVYILHCTYTLFGTVCNEGNTKNLPLCKNYYSIEVTPMCNQWYSTRVRSFFKKRLDHGRLHKILEM